MGHVCARCRVDRSEEDFYTSAKGRRQSYCKDCRRAYIRDWDEKNKDKHALYHLRLAYGLSEEDYDDLVLTQRSACAICYSMDRRLVVDHCHDEGRVRGLLCGQCNRSIGLLGDNPEVLRRAADYLEGKKLAPW